MFIYHFLTKLDKILAQAYIDPQPSNLMLDFTSLFIISFLLTIRYIYLNFRKESEITHFRFLILSFVPLHPFPVLQYYIS